jgi:hypothetical protein
MTNAYSNAYFQSRPESFLGKPHLAKLQEEAKALVGKVLKEKSVSAGPG